MIWFVFLLVTVLVGVFIVSFLLQGLAGFTVISFFILRPIFRLLGRNIESGAAFLDEKMFGISREPEIVSSGPLTDEFKASAKGKLSPDIWHDGRRLYFEVGDKSCSVLTDLEGARKRKNELLAEARRPSPK